MEELIKSKGWSNTYFCKQMGHSKAWISDMKRGVGSPDENTLKVIADKLDTTVDYLTDKTEQKNKPSSEEESFSQNKKELMALFDTMSDAQQESFLAIARAAAHELSLKKIAGTP
jgi:transcriptional regulator with XRE-family HTH domain